MESLKESEQIISKSTAATDTALSSIWELAQESNPLLRSPRLETASTTAQCQAAKTLIICTAAHALAGDCHSEYHSL